MLLSPSRPRRRLSSNDDGFSLLESVVALAILSVVFMALAGALGSTAKAALHARQNQNAINLANEQVERFRGIDVSGVAMQAGDLSTADPNLIDTGAGFQFDPDGAGPEPAEDVVVAEGGAVSPHQLATQVLNNTSYDVSVYVTQPATDAQVAAASYRRLTVVVTYSRGDLVRERRTSTVLTPTRRGLPLPSFFWGTADEATVPAGDSVTLAATLTNRGARDAWNVDSAVTPTQTWTRTWYADDGDGAAESGEELVDTDGDGVVDTGLLETDETVALLLVAAVPSDALGGAATVRVTATSSAQPDHPDASQFFDHALTVVPSSSTCPSCTLTAHYLHNRSTAPVADTTQESTMPFNLTAPTANQLYNYDTNVDGTPGRQLAVGGTGATDTTASRSMVWDYSTSSQKTYGGSSAQLRVWVKAKTAGSAFTLSAHLRYKTGGFTTVTSGTSGVVADNASWQRVTISMPITTNFTVGQNKEMRVVLQVSGAPVDIAYDTSTYSSDLILPVRAS